MDISMGSANEGIVTTGGSESLSPDIRVIMFTVLDDDARYLKAFAGAWGTC